MLIDASTDPDGCDQFADGTPAYLNGNIAQTTFSYDSRLSVALNNSYGSISYDRLGRLKSATSATNAAYHVGTSPALTYDANGNILTMQRGSSPSAVNYNYAPNTNKIAGVGANAYQHDLNGNLTLSPKASLTYDAFTQMTTELLPTTGGAVKLHYNAADERVLKTQGNQATLYLHGLSDYPLVEKSDNGSSFFETRYVYGLGGLIATQRAGQLNFVFKDHLGSTRVVASADGTSGIGYSYDALGNVVQQSAFGNPTSAIAYQYTGQEFDSETQLHNFRARMYDSDLFRFYATDPAGEQHSPYAFVGNSPLMFRDPSGKFIETAIAFAIFAGLQGSAMNAANGGNFGTIVGSFFKNAAISFATSSLGYGLNMALPVPMSEGLAALKGAGVGIATGAFSSALSGGNILQGSLMGGGFGALGGLGGYSHESRAKLLAAEKQYVDDAGEVLWRVDDGRSEVTVVKVSTLEVYAERPAMTTVASAFARQASQAAAYMSGNAQGDWSNPYYANRYSGRIDEADNPVDYLIGGTGGLVGKAAKKVLPALDATGKVHGTLPKIKDLSKYSKDELETLLKDLKQSVQRRISVTSQLGRDKSHGQRQGAEHNLIKAIEKYLQNK